MVVSVFRIHIHTRMQMFMTTFNATHGSSPNCTLDSYTMMSSQGSFLTPLGMSPRRVAKYSSE